MTGGVAVVGYGTAVPHTTVTNADLAQLLDTSDEWIVERTGIRERRIASPTESTATLATDAGAKALASAGVSPGGVDLCLVATVTPEQPVPATAAFVQHRLGLACGAFDVGAACAGFVYALVTAAAMVNTGHIKNVLVIGAETTSRWIDPTDRNTAVLFGDGAAAVVLSASDTGSLIAFDLGCDGSAIPFLEVRGGGSRLPASRETVDGGEHWLRMEGKEVFRRAVRAVTGSVEKTLTKAGLPADEVDVFVPHQANERILDAVLPRIGIARERTIVNVGRYGNTSAASVPLALCEALEEGRVNDGDHVLMTGFGAGMAWATALMRWSVA